MKEVDHLLSVPTADQALYANRLQQSLVAASLKDLPTQAFVVVDRNPQVQAVFVVVRLRGGSLHWIGATSVSTGKPGRFEHFYTPLGVFAHSLDNPDFRAEGSFNKNHIRGYGLRGRRVFDFGWQIGERGWGKGGVSQMRLQMHATDPDVLEQRLGQADSEGCIRIPATLNLFLDRLGVLDSDYTAAIVNGNPLWVIQHQGAKLPWPGRYLVIIDSRASGRPSWSPAPGLRKAIKPASAPVVRPFRVSPGSS
ncbi:MAG: L,D-transpeptidase [Burkholderiales bacterium]|nr:L,D-transpeptidase [Burkholderiales bacterium]